MTEPPHKPGMLHRLTEQLAQADIDIHHLYATASTSQAQCLLVFATANNDRAMVSLNASTGATVALGQRTHLAHAGRMTREQLLDELEQSLG